MNIKLLLLSILRHEHLGMEDQQRIAVFAHCDHLPTLPHEFTFVVFPLSAICIKHWLILIDQLALSQYRLFYPIMSTPVDFSADIVFRLFHRLIELEKECIALLFPAIECTAINLNFSTSERDIAVLCKLFKKSVLLRVFYRCCTMLFYAHAATSTTLRTSSKSAT